MTPPSIEEMERLEKAATKGPWYALGRTVQPDVPGLEQLRTILRCTLHKKEAESDADFIAAARTFVPWAISKIRELENERVTVEMMAAYNAPWEEALRAKDREIEELRQKVEDLEDTISGMQTLHKVETSGVSDMLTYGEVRARRATKGAKG